MELKLKEHVEHKLDWHVEHTFGEHLENILRKLRSRPPGRAGGRRVLAPLAAAGP